MDCLIKIPCPGTKKVRVIVPASHSHTGHEYSKVVSIDACIADVVEAFQTSGIKTTGSCCGHGKNPGSIKLDDGREFIILFPNNVTNLAAAYSAIQEMLSEIDMELSEAGMWRGGRLDSIRHIITANITLNEIVEQARAEGVEAERERLLELANQLDERVKIVKETARLGSIHVAGIREQWARELESIAAAIRTEEAQG